MKLSLLLLNIFLFAGAAASQTEPVFLEYFPEESAFEALGKVSLERVFEDPARLSSIDGGPLFAAAGFGKYRQRVYALPDGGTLSIEIVTLFDSLSAYSMLTLMRGSHLRKGPPGVAYAETAGGIVFSHGNELVRIKNMPVSKNLIMPAALSVGNRIGASIPKAPTLISHLPTLGYDASSMRYFSGLEIYKAYRGTAAAPYLSSLEDTEIAQARYFVDRQAADLYLLDFPTPEAAEDYFAQLQSLESFKHRDGRVYAKRVGPLVAILDGSLDPNSADRVLNPLKYSYSVSWIYEDDNQSGIVWGIPTSILRTVVQSLYFVGLLGLASIAAGAVLAFIRFFFFKLLHRNSRKQQGPNEILRLRLR